MSENYKSFMMNEQKTADKALQFFSDTVPENFKIFTPVQIDFPKKLHLGKNIYIDHGFTVMAAGGLSIGSNTLISACVTIDTNMHDCTNSYALSCKCVVIGSNVWIGKNTQITAGVTIGDNAVIVGKSVVTQDIPANTIAAGNPAKVILYLADM